MTRKTFILSVFTLLLCAQQLLSIEPLPDSSSWGLARHTLADLRRSSISIGVRQFFQLDQKLYPAHYKVKHFNKKGSMTLFDLTVSIRTPGAAKPVSVFNTIHGSIGGGTLRDDYYDDIDLIYANTSYSANEFPNFYVNADYHIGLESCRESPDLAAFTGVEYTFRQVRYDNDDDIRSFTNSTTNFVKVPLGLGATFSPSVNFTLGFTYINRLLVYGDYEGTTHWYRGNYPYNPDSTRTIDLKKSRLKMAYGYGIELPMQILTGNRVCLKIMPWLNFQPYGVAFYVHTVDTTTGIYTAEVQGHREIKMIQAGLSLSIMFFTRPREAAFKRKNTQSE
jgi:hypothetical protein